MRCALVFCVGSTSEGDGTIAADEEEAGLSCDDDDDDDDENEGEGTDGTPDDAMIEEVTGNDDAVSYAESRSLKVEEDVVMKTFNAEDDDELGNTSYTDDGSPLMPGKQEGYESPEVKMARNTPEKQFSLPSPDVESVLHEPAGSFPEPLGSSVARLESFVASVVAADRKRPVPFREPCGSPPPPPTRSVPAALPLLPVPSRSRHSKAAKTTSRASKSPTSMSQSAASGRVNRATRVAAQINLPPSLVSPSPPAGQSSLDQPLDLSTKSRRESQYLCPDVASAGPSSLLSLERQFGKGSAIFDRIGTKAWAAPYCAAALRLGVQSLAAFGSGLGLVSPPSPSTSRRLAPGRPYKDREMVAYPLVNHQQPPPMSPSATTTDVSSLLPWAQPPESKRTSSASASTASGVPSSSHLHTNLRCGCGASMDNLFALTVL